MDFQFCAEITDFKIVYNVLKAISFKEFAVIRPMEEGLKVTVEEMKCVETSVYIPSNMFTSYYVDPNEEITFKISLKVLTECLHIFGDDSNPSLKLTYKATGFPLCLVIKHSEENITVDCEIRTIDVEEFTELNLAEECTENKIVVNAGPLVEILSDLDNSSDELELLLSPEPPCFRITANGTMGDSQIDISKNSEMILIFQCSTKTVYRYAFSNIRQILKVLNYASKVSISTGKSGLLGLQLVINSDDRQMYVEYYVTSLFADD